MYQKVRQPEATSERKATGCLPFRLHIGRRQKKAPIRAEYTPPEAQEQRKTTPLVMFYQQVKEAFAPQPEPELPLGKKLMDELHMLRAICTTEKQRIEGVAVPHEPLLQQVLLGVETFTGNLHITVETFIKALNDSSPRMPVARVGQAADSEHEIVVAARARRLSRRQRRQLAAAMRAKIEDTLHQLTSTRAELSAVTSDDLRVLSGPVNKLSLLAKQLDDSIASWQVTLYGTPRQR